MQEEDEEAFEEKMKHLTNELSDQLEKGQDLNEEIRRNLKTIGYAL